MMQEDLFSTRLYADGAPMRMMSKEEFDATYPSSPGFKDRDTSRLAADRMADSADRLRDECYRALFGSPLTADEVAARLDRSILSIRPRMTELLKLGRIRDTGDRRKIAGSMGVRRLMPVECERLQGFPDDFTLVPNRHGKPMADGPRYKMLGNSKAVPVIGWVLDRLERMAA